MGQVYECADCGHYRPIPEDPVTGPVSQRMGCDNCSRIQRHHAVGRSTWHVHHGVPTYGGDADAE